MEISTLDSELIQLLDSIEASLHEQEKSVHQIEQIDHTKRVSDFVNDICKKIEEIRGHLNIEEKVA